MCLMQAFVDPTTEGDHCRDHVRGSHSHGKAWKNMETNIVMESDGKLMDNGQKK